MTASLVTEQAVGLARRLADDFDDASSAEDRTYRRMFVEFFFDLACRTQSPSCSGTTHYFHDGLEFDVEVMSETVDWIFLESYVYITRPQTLMKAKPLKETPSQAQDFPFRSDGQTPPRNDCFSLRRRNLRPVFLFRHFSPLPRKGTRVHGQHY